MASGRFMEEMMREHEQSLLEATCGGLFDHIEDLLDFPKEDSAADVLLLDAPVPDSPLAARVLGGGVPPPAPASLDGQQQASLMVPPPPPAGDHSAAFLGALGDTHIGTVSNCFFPLPSFVPIVQFVGVGGRACVPARARLVGWLPTPAYG